MEGFVYGPDGLPTQGALVLSSAGGSTMTDAEGHYRLEITPPLGAHSVQLTAAGGGARNLLSSQQVALSNAPGQIQVRALQLASGGTCDPSWLPTFGGQPGTNFFVRDFAVFDDGGGEALYAGGNFASAGGELVYHIAKWDGTLWSALGVGTSSNVHALAVFDDGGGQALYAGGEFLTASGLTVNKIAKWNGSNWSALGSGLDSPSSPGSPAQVYDLAVFDDGSGEALFAGGRFTVAGGVSANFIAKWDGTSWSALGSGMSGFSSVSNVNALEVFDDGSGEALYAAGQFLDAGGVAVNRVAKWDGASWSALGAGLGPAAQVSQDASALMVYDDGSGEALYAAGNFALAGGLPANHIAKWNGSVWSALGSGVGLTIGERVISLTTFDDGTGSALYAGGQFTQAGGVAANRLAKWDGSNWSSVGSLNGTAHSLIGFDDGQGPALYVGGIFSGVDAVFAKNVAKRTASNWTALGIGIDGAINATAVYDDGDGAALYVAGTFASAGGVAALRIAKWDGSSWSALGLGVGSGLAFNKVTSLAVYDDGGGEELYAAGNFDSAGGITANHIAKWDGQIWSRVGTQIRNGTAGPIDCMAVFDDGSGETLYVGGTFLMAATVVPASGIARWNGLAWSGVSGGLTAGIGTNLGVDALQVFDDGTGAALYVGGDFDSAGAVPVNDIARWDGSNWSDVGGGVSTIFAASAVCSLAVFDDGAGAALYVGGNFEQAGSVPALHIAKWDGSGWSPLGSGLGTGGPTFNSARSLRTFDDGAGEALYVGGLFDVAGGVAALNIAKWDGSNWSAMGGGLHLGTSSMVVFNDGSGESLFVGGSFSASDAGDSYLAKWGCLDTSAPVIQMPTSLTVIDRLMIEPGEIVNFEVSVSDDRDPEPELICSPPPGSLFLPGTTLVTCTATDASGNTTMGQFLVTVQRRGTQR